MTIELKLFFARRQIPQSHRLVIGAGGKGETIARD